ncbi:Phytyl ester synthase 1, chloroplastic [Linum perenne]
MSIATAGACFSTACCPPAVRCCAAPPDDKLKLNPLPVPNRRLFAVSFAQTTAGEAARIPFPVNGDLLKGSQVEGAGGEVEKEEQEQDVNPYAMAVQRPETIELGKSLKDYFEEAKDLIKSSHGGPPLWISPPDCGSPPDTSPLFLYLPGIDGVGLGLIRHHYDLAKMFNTRCLHIPVKDRTSFRGLVQLVEITVREEYRRFPRRPIYLCGESLGACIALAVAARNPEIDLVLILANPGTSFEKSQLRALMPLLELLPNNYQLNVPFMLSLMTGDPLKMFVDNVVRGLPLRRPTGGLEVDVLLPSHIISILFPWPACSSVSQALAEILPKETLLWKLRLLESASSYANARLHAVKAQVLILSRPLWLMIIISSGSSLLPVVYIETFNSIKTNAVNALLSGSSVERISCFQVTRKAKDYVQHCQKVSFGHLMTMAISFSWCLLSLSPLLSVFGRKFTFSNFHMYNTIFVLMQEDGPALVTTIKGSMFYRRGRNRDHISDYIPPTPLEFKKIVDKYRELMVATNPAMFSTMNDGKIVKGLGGIPSEGPVLFVGYHMLLGLEVSQLVTQVLLERNVLVRGIAHPMLFSRLKDGFMPPLSSFDDFRVMGAAPVSGSVLFKLLSSKAHVLLYPGGMREACHRKGEEYKLFWPEHSEFVRMAARFGAKIVPFGVVGEDDYGEVVFDYNDQMKIPYLRNFLESTTEEIPQVRTEADGEVSVQGVHFPILRPKFPGRFYYLFGKPIETQGRKEELSKEREKAHELYLEVKQEVYNCIDYLKEKRESDPYRNVLSRMAYQTIHGFDSPVPAFEI